MNHLLRERDLIEAIECDSAGTASYHIGSPPDRRMAKAAQERGIALEGRARQLQPSDLESFDWILAMDESNYQDILRLDPENRYRHKIRKMCDFCRNFNDTDVPDPYYGGEAGFRYVIDLLSDACEGFLDHLLQEKTPASL